MRWTSGRIRSRRYPNRQQVMVFCSLLSEQMIVDVAPVKPELVSWHHLPNTLQLIQSETGWCGNRPR